MNEKEAFTLMDKAEKAINIEIPKPINHTGISRKINLDALANFYTIVRNYVKIKAKLNTKNHCKKTIINNLLNGI